MDYKHFQKEVNKWSKRNFGTGVKRLHQPLLGITEEFGELVRGFQVKNTTEIKDAGGDLMIYLTDYCCQNKYDLATIVELSKSTFIDFTFEDRLLLSMAVIIGKFNHCHLKIEQNIRNNEKLQSDLVCHLATIIAYLNCFLVEYEMTLDECISFAWIEVRSRDWKKYPKNGKTE